MNGRVWRSRQQRNGMEPNSFHNMTCNDHGILRPRIPKLVIQILKKSLLKIVWVLASSIRQYIISCRTDKMKSFLIKTRPTSISSKTASNFIGRFDYDKWFWFQIKTWMWDWIWTFIFIDTKLHNRSNPICISHDSCQHHSTYEWISMESISLGKERIASSHS